MNTWTPADDRLLDRLVDGELSDADRRGLVARLDADPAGWRRCALAFLEAQVWREALGRSPAEVLPAPTVVPAPAADGHRRFRHVAGLAAGLAAAVCLGWLLRGPGPAPRPQAASVEVATPEPRPQDPPLAAAPRSPDPAGPARPGDGFEPVVKRWEHIGYKVERQDRLVAVELPDGRRMAVPGQEMRLHYVGKQSY